MATPVIMPKAGMSMEEGTIVQWAKTEGDSISKGEVILEIETDKVSMEVEAEVSGILLSIVATEGTVVPVTRTIAWIGEAGEIPEISEVAPDRKHPVQTKDSEEKQQSQNINSRPPEARKKALGFLSETESHPIENLGKIKATPAARRLAGELTISLKHLSPTGRHGEIRARDVERMRSSTPTVSGVNIATVHIDPDITMVLKLQEDIRSSDRSAPKLVAIVAKAVALALRQTGVPFTKDKSIRIGVAAENPEGFIFPVIEGAETLSVKTLSNTIDSPNNPESPEPPPLVLIDLGKYGVSVSAPGLIAGSQAVLGMGAPRKRLVLRNDTVVEITELPLALSLDTTRISLLEGSRILSAVRSYLRYPMALA